MKCIVVGVGWGVFSVTAILVLGGGVENSGLICLEYSITW